MLRVCLSLFYLLASGTIVGLVEFTFKTPSFDVAMYMGTVGACFIGVPLMLLFMPETYYGSK